jgi:hypothetical protein
MHEFSGCALVATPTSLWRVRPPLRRPNRQPRVRPAQRLGARGAIHAHFTVGQSEGAEIRRRKIESFERHEESPNMTYTARSVRRALRAHRSPSAATSALRSPSDSAASIANGELGWRKYSWHWKLRREAGKDARRKITSMDQAEERQKDFDRSAPVASTPSRAHRWSTIHSRAHRPPVRREVDSSVYQYRSVTTKWMYCT